MTPCEYGKIQFLKFVHSFDWETHKVMVLPISQGKKQLINEGLEYFLFKWRSPMMAKKSFDLLQYFVPLKFYTIFKIFQLKYVAGAIHAKTNLGFVLYSYEK